MPQIVLTSDSSGPVPLSIRRAFLAGMSTESAKDPTDYDEDAEARFGELLKSDPGSVSNSRHLIPLAK